MELLWNEGNDGDLVVKNNDGILTPDEKFSLSKGSNIIRGQTKGNPNLDIDGFTFKVPPGHVVTAINFNKYENQDSTGAPVGFVGISEGTSFDLNPPAPGAPSKNLGGTLVSNFVPPKEGDVLGILEDLAESIPIFRDGSFIEPGTGFEEPLLVPGDYTLILQETAGVVDYELDIQIQSIPTRQGTGKGDRLRGTRRDDIIVGKEGNDTVTGGRGKDIIAGQEGNDNLTGGPGNDKLYGGAGNDNLIGGLGADHLAGGSGFDRYEGGAGADRFILVPGEGRTRIVDFTPGVDTLDLTALGYASKDQLRQDIATPLVSGSRGTRVNFKDDENNIGLGSEDSIEFVNLNRAQVRAILSSGSTII